MGPERGNNRSSSFEIMRIVAMFMIVVGHCLMSTVLHDAEPLSVCDNVAWLISAFGICAVNLFFLLTGYFLCDRKNKISKIIMLWGKTVFVSIGIYLAACTMGIVEFNKKDFIQFLFPVLFKKYWFIQTYIVLALLLPFILKMVKTLSDRQHLALVVILLIFFCIHQTFIPVKYTLDTTQGYGIAWGTILAITGSLIKRNADRIKKIVPVWICLGGYIFVALGIFITNWLIVKFDIAQGITSRANFYAYNSVSVFLEAIFLFLFFVKMEGGWKSNIVVNQIGKSTVAVYIISAHPVLFTFLWTDVFKLNGVIERSIVLYFCEMLISVAVVFIICVIIDKIIGKFGELLRIDQMALKADKLLKYIFI